MRFILSATRWLIAAVTSLHLASLKGAATLSARNLAKVGAQRDAAEYARRMASNQAILARSIEKNIATQHGALVIAAQAEARSLRRGYAVA